MEKDKVSIIIPMYNAEKFIARAIESVCSQTYQNWELLIINDKSKDKSFEIANEFAKKDDRIKIVNVKENVGVVRGRNQLIEKATGKYIAFLDADDFWHKKKLEKQINFMKEKDAAISCTEYMRVREDETKINEVIIKEKISYKDMLKNNYLGCLTVIYDAQKLGKRYFKQRDKNEDYVLWLEIVKEVKVIYGLKENLAFYRVLDNSRSSNKFKTAKVRWEIYRNEEKLPFFSAIYYFIQYAFFALKKSK